ncbi:protein CURLY FLAG LEAF 1-like [Typha angustifolia]|uniref:protein CURLY FLAG LEAF 1-like n=1 Tax=Typha angustifolia TaxID=59011 RepID=UPI003C304099
MSAPTIEMIANSLRSCSLGRRPTRTPSPPPQLVEASDDSGGVQLELNSNVALPYHWEQCLDIRTGKIYYINWEDGTTTTTDPRISTSTIITTTISSSSDDEDSTSDHVGKVGDRSGSTTGYSSNLSALSSDESSTAESVVGGGSDGGFASDSAQVLVAAGCKACFMYFMVPKRVECCSRCGGELLLLGRDGCV